MGQSINFNPSTDIGSLEGKVILVTGGNAGLGLQTIRNLCTHAPTRIYLAARTPSKASAAIKALRISLPHACEIIHLPLDLSSFPSIRAAATTFLARESRLDILINNAGVLALPYATTPDGYEIQFGTNHLGHALFTKLLLPALLAAQDARVVTVSSIGHNLTPRGGVMLDQSALREQHTWRRYGNSKLANILWTKQLAARYPGLTCVSLHPGVIVTDIYASVAQNVVARAALWVFSLLAAVLPGCFASVEGGAKCQTWAATVGKGELESGGYYRPIGVRSRGSRCAGDEGLGKKLWEWTEGEFERCGY
ncbi:retinol dehydrogenase 12 [Ophiobolus disseminans]|uniref:Retinol dehydrogenase 12 n=1 Tax=Ophiobolus disseminans TaxID=1469910 RepID=A0A6A7ABW5_9PLEO|nr:retinol dehydrogenase 12 [Ophiobolus disseminans]